MEHLRNNSMASVPSTGAAGTSMFTVSDMTPETVISELNLFRPATTQWDITTCTTQGTSYTTSSSGMSASLPSPTQSSTSTTTMVNGDSGQGDLNGTSSDVCSSHTSGDRALSPGGDGDENRDDVSEGQPPRKKRVPVPEEKKDNKYWERRRKNNEAAKKSRNLRRKKMDDELKIAKEAIQENQKLKQEIDVLKAEINSLRRLLKDANMTLSLWIRARQASEPAAQLPPMLRGSNVSFVNFPVSTAI